MYYTPCILFHTFLWSGKQEHDMFISHLIHKQSIYFSSHSPYECTDFLLNMSDTELGNPGGKKKKKKEKQRCKFGV